MHMADALLSAGVAGTMYACSGAVTAYSVKKVRRLDEVQTVPVMGVMGAFVFAAQMINFTIPGTGSSGHLCGGMLLSAILGPEAGFLTMIGVLLIQCLLFADGGLLALGANIWNMAFFGCFLGGAVIWRLFMRHGMSRAKIVAASVLGSVVSLELGALCVCLETLASGVTKLPFQVFLAAMMPIHLAIGLVEGLITSGVLLFIYQARPQLLAGYEQKDGQGMNWKGVLGILTAAAAVTAGLLSLVASSLPDGLEWSMQQVAGTTELTARGWVYDMAAKIQNLTSFLPDYQWQGHGEAAGTSLAGLLGAVAAVVLCAGICQTIKVLKKKKHHG